MELKGEGDELFDDPGREGGREGGREVWLCWTKVATGHADKPSIAIQRVKVRFVRHGTYCRCTMPHIREASIPQI